MLASDFIEGRMAIFWAKARHGRENKKDGCCQMPWVRGRNFQKGSRGNLGEVEVAPYVLQYGGNMTVKIHENQPFL